MLQKPYKFMTFCHIIVDNLLWLFTFWSYLQFLSSSNGNCSARDNEDGAAGTSEQYGEDEAFASEQGREANDEQESPQVEENSGYFNYQTYMDKTPIARWSKQDTELFYEVQLDWI